MDKKDRIRYLHPKEDEAPEFFGDSVQIKMSPFGFRFTFGLIGDSPTEVRPTANIRMSPQLARALKELLTKQIEIYEKSVGPIHLPKELFPEIK